MENYPFVKCLEPQHIKNPYTGQTMLVNCGKCAVCQSRKGAVNTLKCQLESMSHKYHMFVTLTYANEYLPTAQLEADFRLIPNFNESDYRELPFMPQDKDMYRIDRTRKSYYMYDSVTHEPLGIYHPAHSLAIQQLKDKFNLNGLIPYLRKRDLQLFLKRLRKRLDEKIRYFAVGEYGPVHYRPHYHLEIWFDRDETYRRFLQAVREAWKFGRIDASLSKGKSSNYVAAYLNSACNLPQVFSFSKTRPFNTHSYFLGETILKKSREEVYENGYREFTQRSLSVNGTHTDVHLWRSLTATYFPKCKAFTQKSYAQREYSYSLFSVASDWTKETTAFRAATKIADYIKFFGFSCDSNEHADILLTYLKKSLDIKALELHSALRRDWLITSIYSELRVSKHYLDFVRPYFKTHSEAIARIDRHYKECAQEQLSNWYKLQEEYILSGYTDSLHLMYDTYEQEELQVHPEYLSFRSYRMKLFKDSVKHKDLNDKNLIFNNI